MPSWFWPVAGPLIVVVAVFFLRQFRFHIQKRKAERQKPPAP